MIERRGTVPAWVALAAAALFLLHAANYLYFFVDDEAIPFVYAQNLLNGRGLSYNTLEGRLEGYSDFLHVLWSSVILTVVRAAGYPKYSVFFVGKAVSLLCGVGILLVVWMVLRRSRAGLAAGITGLGTLALAGPLVTWSCSSLEAVPFALMATGLLASLMLDLDGWAALTAGLLVFERIDGFVYAGLLLAAFLVTASPERRHEMLWRIALPVGVVFVAYQGWRWWYFRDLIPAPVEAKILYKLAPHRNLVVKAPDRSYLISFISASGWPAAIACAASASYALMRGGPMRRVALAALALTAYVALVGDWMFGFRFFVVLLPLYTLILADTVTILGATRRRLAAIACLLLLGCAAVAAVRFFETYTRAGKMPSFVRNPSRDLHRFFLPYYGLYEMTRRLVAPGEVIAYNQAGFVPFMLDVDNIDDLGICSRFPADVPTTDLYFTEVGRYAPLTNKRMLRPINAYLLYENVKFVMSRTDILRRANYDQIPKALLGGEYELVATDPGKLNAVYRRSESPRRPLEPRMFVENLAHVSYLRDVQIGAQRLDPQDYAAQLPFLHDDLGSIRFVGSTTLSMRFHSDEHVTGISIEDVRTDRPARLRVRLMKRTGRPSATRPHTRRNSWTVVSVARRPRDRPQHDTGGTPSSDASGRLWIDDLRCKDSGLRSSGTSPGTCAFLTGRTTTCRRQSSLLTAHLVHAQCIC